MDKEERKELTIEILKTAAVLSVLTATAIIAPAGIGVVGKLFLSFRNEYDHERHYRYQAKRAIKRLSQRGLIITESKGEELVVHITQAGRRWLRRYDATHMAIARPKRWDGLWRIVIFDIPEDRREIRDIVRSWLKRLGFARLQKSAWVIPWPCRKQFYALAAEYKLGNQAILLESKLVAKQAALQRTFKINHYMSIDK